MSDAWTDPPSSAGLSKCVRCTKQTTSHAVCLRDTAREYQPGSEDEHDLMFPVCHTCYRDIDGDAQTLCDELNADRSPMLDDAGLTPSLYSEFVSADDMDTDRVKAIGESTVEDMVSDLVPGDVVIINDEYRWILVPTAETTKERLQGNLLFTLMTVEDVDGAGGIVRSQHPMKDDLFIAERVGDDESSSLNYKPIETMELVGHKDTDMDPMEYAGENQ